MSKSKFFKLTVILVFSVLLLVGCRRDDNGTGNGDEQVVLIWWNMFESEANVKPIIDAFEAEHPNVVIQYHQQGISGGVDAYKTLLDNALTDNDPLTTPDIFTVENTWAEKYKQYISPAPNDVITQDDISDFYPIVQSEFNNQGLTGLPLYVDSLAVIYNKDKLIESGYTIPDDQWSEFQNQAVDMTLRDSAGNIVQSGFAGATADNTQFNFEIISLLMLQNGVNLSGANGVNLDAQDTALDSFNFYNVFSGRSGSWDQSQKLEIASFLEGKLAMFIAPSWRLNDVLIYNDEYNLNLSIGVAPIPQLAGTDTIHWGTYWGQSVAKDSPNARVAWEFVKFMSEPEQLRTLDQTVKSNGRKVGIFYPRLSMASEIADDENLSVYVQSIPFARTWPMYDGYSVEAEFNDYFKEGGGNLGSLEQSVNQIINSSP